MTPEDWDDAEHRAQAAAYRAEYGPDVEAERGYPAGIVDAALTAPPGHTCHCQWASRGVACSCVMCCDAEEAEWRRAATDTERSAYLSGDPADDAIAERYRGDYPGHATDRSHREVSGQELAAHEPSATTMSDHD